MDTYDFQTIEAHWQTCWEAEHTHHQCEENSNRPKFYALEMFPYPSGIGLHAGHLKNYIPTDAFCRYKAMNGFDVMYPMGWDAFGQPAENEAIKQKRNPREMVEEYSANFRRTMKRLGISYNWNREITTSDPGYYKWTQWFFLLLYKRGLAYRATASINWCPGCNTGLANEEVKEGRCWRCDTSITKRPMPQWYFRITDYAERLLSDLDQVDWPEGVKQMQREWIGRSEGAEMQFPLVSGQGSIEIFTTRPDTVFGATFLVLAPEHPMVQQITTPDQKRKVEEYTHKAQIQTDIQRTSTERTCTGEFTGAYAINPLNGEEVPVWVADYVLISYGTGAIMCVPAHDHRDFLFAAKFKLPIRRVYQLEDVVEPADGMSCALPDGGVAVNAGPFTGYPNSPETVSQFIKWLAETGKGKPRVSYKLRDWLISRQRYWGTPIPMVQCTACGTQPVSETDIPVLLPDCKDIAVSGTGESPLSAISDFTKTACPKCGSVARRETDTMGGFACSSWYFMRFADPKNQSEFASRTKLDHWLPVDLYTGGTEHAVMHLLYARFWTKVLYDSGLVSFNEPFRELRNQGMMLAYTPGRRPREGEKIGDADQQIVDWIVLKPEERDSFAPDQIVWRWAKMSKSKGNGIDPERVISKVGADCLRLYILFVAPFECDVRWSEEGLIGASRFMNRLWRWVTSAVRYYDRSWSMKLPSQSFSLLERKVRRRLHQSLHKVGSDLGNFSFNTAVAALMELVNELYAYAPVDENAMSQANSLILSEVVEILALMISPLVPHAANELWHMMGKIDSLYKAGWPDYDKEAAREEEITVALQINGKLRDRMTVSADIDAEGMKTLALQNKYVVDLLNQNKKVVNLIVVPKRLVNVVMSP